MPVDLVIIEDQPEGCTVVKLCGELDIASAPDLREQLLVILDRRAPRCLILDLSELEFMDSSGIAVLVNTNRRAGLIGCVFALVAPQAPVSRVLRVSGLDQYFHIFENLSAAQNACDDLSQPFRLGLIPKAGETGLAAT
jgi:anti-sigma B factor antagonist